MVASRFAISGVVDAETPTVEIILPSDVPAVVAMMVFIVRILNSRAFRSTILRRNVARMLLKCGANVARAGPNYGLSQDFAEFPPYFLALGCPGPTPLQPCEGAEKIKVQKKTHFVSENNPIQMSLAFSKTQDNRKGPLRGSGPS